MGDTIDTIRAGVNAVGQSSPVLRAQQLVAAVGDTVKPYVDQARASYRRLTTPAPTKKRSPTPARRQTR